MLDEENQEELTPEEKETIQRVENGMRKTVDAFLSPVYSVLDWCVPATIFAFAIRFIANHTGWDGLISPWLATIFLWGPLILSLVFSGIVITGFYVFSLLCVWHKFCVGIVEYFKAGFWKGNGNDEDQN